MKLPLRKMLKQANCNANIKFTLAYFISRYVTTTLYFFTATQLTKQVIFRNAEDKSEHQWTENKSKYLINFNYYSL